MTMTLNGSGTITGLSAGGLPDATIQTADIVDANVTQAKLAANVAGNGPAFRVYQTSGTSVSNTTFTKVLFDTTTFDTTSGMFASSRFTPTVAGYYQVTGIVRFSFSAGNFLSPYIYKNGFGYQGVEGVLTQGSGDVSGSVTSLVYCNGSTDYIELYVYQSSGVSKTTIAGAVNTSFASSMVRAA